MVNWNGKSVLLDYLDKVERDYCGHYMRELNA